MSRDILKRESLGTSLRCQAISNELIHMINKARQKLKLNPFLQYGIIIDNLLDLAFKAFNMEMIYILNETSCKLILPNAIENKTFTYYKSIDTSISLYELKKNLNLTLNQVKKMKINEVYDDVLYENIIIYFYNFNL